MAYFPIIPAACMSLIFSKIAFTVFALCQIVNHFGPPAKFYGPAATRWSDPAGRRLRLDHRKRSDVLRLRVEGSVAEKPNANEPRWGWRHPTRQRIAPRRSGNARTCEVPWHNF